MSQYDSYVRKHKFELLENGLGHLVIVRAYLVEIIVEPVEVL